jgi:hypothetical protein
MNELALDAATELLAVAGSAAGAAAFTIGGLMTEQDGLQKIMAGQTTLGGWEAAVGMVG